VILKGESKSLESDTACLLFCIQKPFKAWGLWGFPDGTNEKTGLLSVNLKGGESKSLESDTACLLFCIQKPFKAWGLWGFWIQKSTGKAGAFK
jgi:hypothetical protein